MKNQDFSRPLPDVDSHPSSPAQHHLSAAEGFLGLRMFEESHRELELADRDLRLRMAVAAVKLDLYLAEKDWKNAASYGEVLADLDPEYSPYSYKWAQALHAQGKTEQALGVIEELDEEFEHDSEFRYESAFYNAACGQLQSAIHHLGQAVAMDSTYRLKAAEEPLLCPLLEMILPGIELDPPKFVDEFGSDYDNSLDHIFGKPMDSDDDDDDDESDIPF